VRFPSRTPTYSPANVDIARSDSAVRSGEMTGRPKRFRQSFVFYVLRRVLVLLVLLVAISFVVFSFEYITPGNVVDTLLGLTPKTPETVRTLRHEYHLDKPFLEQYWIWARGAAHFQFGNSLRTTIPVSETLKSRLPTSLFLAAYAYVLTMVFGLLLGSWAAVRKRGPVDRGLVAGSIIGLSTPAFVSGICLLWLFAIELPWFPSFGLGSGFFDELWHLTLPATALALVSIAFVLKHARASMIAVLDQDYVTFARARGLSGVRIFFTYSLRNALIPVVTVSGIILAFLITGAVLVEVTFSLSGIGSLLVQAATTKDLPVLQGVVLVVAVTIMVANLLVDLAYASLDPRIRLGVTNR
jgi:peptide/nickel transport system permease protein